MSLQLAAEHLSTKGRGPDDTLVHMSRGEVKSLNDLAMAHGGHLTINPETGLPEAGFLSMILPMVAGAALGPAGFGLTSALGAGLAVGAGSYLLNPKAGLMGALSAGMGAYGAANLGQALAVEGMNASVPTAAQVTPESLKPFTTDPTAYIGQGPTTSQFGAFGESLGQVPSTPSAYNPVGAGNLESMASYPAGAPAPEPFIKGTAGEYLANPQHPDYNLLKSNPTVNSGAPLMASNAPATPVPSNAAGSFQPSTITQPLVSPNASVADLKNMTVSERLGAMQKGLTSGDLGKVASENYGSVAAVASPLLTKKNESVAPVVDRDRGQQYSYSPGVARPLPAANVPTYEDMLTKQGNFGQQQNYYPDQGYTPISNERAKEMYHYAADGGLMGYAGGGPVEQMSNNAMMGVNTMYPMANITTSSYGTPDQMAEGGEANAAPAYTYDPQTQRYTSSAPAVPMGAGAGEGIGAAMSMAYNPQTQQFTGGNLPTGQIYLGGGQYGPNEAARKAAAEAAAAASSSGAARGGLMGYADGGTADDGFLAAVGRSFGVRPLKKEDENPGLKYTYNPDEQQYVQQQATGGIADARYNLGGYSDGGRLLRGPGDGVSDSIPAVIGKKQPARLADGEFVVPARIVSELGNGSTEAGARKLYAMMDRIQSARKKTVGKGKVAHNSRAVKYLPA